MPAGEISALPIGTVVHQRYRILAVVGQGGLGTVYQVSDVLFGKNNVYALKELIDQSDGARRQFENESQWLQSLDHNHIPKVREHFEWARRLYLVMDFVDGENLEQKLARAGGHGLPEPQVLTWIAPICDALTYMHERMPPILHRDVKPANIIVTPAGHPVLVDLGIAKEHLPGANQTATFVRKAGTEGYAAPEQYTASGPTGPWSDVYGVGATLYQLLTGRVPPTAVERAALDRKLAHPRGVNPAISQQTDAVVYRALELRPFDRYQTMSELKAALALSLGADSQRSLEATLNQPHPPTPAGRYPLPGVNVSQPAVTPIVPPTLPPMSAGPTPPRPATPARPLTSPPYASPRSEALARADTGRELRPGLALRTQPGLGYTTSQRMPVAPSGEALVAAARAAVRATAVSPAKKRRRLRVVPVLIGIGAVCVVLAALMLGMALLRAATPPDRSTAQATISGYFTALSAQDYTRAWQYVAASRNDESAQASFANSLTSDDARYGRVLTYHIVQLESDNSDQVSAQVSVTRADAPSDVLTYTVALTQYGGDTWLVNSVTAS